MEKIKFKELDINSLVSEVFPYSKELEITETLYSSKGIYDWNTFYIFLHDKVIDYNYLFIICKYSSSTRKVFIEKENVKSIMEELNTSSNHARFFNNTDLVPYFNRLSVNEAYRLVSYLKERGIKLFEPTE